MKREIPWVIATVAIIAFVTTFSELQRIRGRFGEMNRYQDSNHRFYREFVIRSELARADYPIIVIGDSITERAKFPNTIDGKRVINAGMGGATIEDFERIAPFLIEREPYLVVVALGTNDTVDSLRLGYRSLLIRLKQFSPRLLVVSINNQEKNIDIKAAADREGVRFVEMPLLDSTELYDNIHPNTDGYRKWMPAVVAAIESR